MKIFAIFTIQSGNFNEGFNIALECREITLNNIKIIGEKTGILHNNFTIVSAYKNWYNYYVRYMVPLDVKSDDFEFYDLPSEIEVYQSQQISHINEEQLRQQWAIYTNKLKEEMKTWLNTNASEWRKIREYFIWIKTQYQLVEIMPIMTVANAVNAEDRKILYKLPWHEWDLLNPQGQTRIEMAKSYNSNVFNSQNITAQKHGKVRILTILGDDTNLELQEQEKKSIQKLNKIADTNHFIAKPTQKELVGKLRDRTGFDILIYSGHSHSNKLGIRDLTGSELEEFDKSLKFAVENGLKIAILNSCDNLQIAKELLNYGISVVIAMKEVVPEEVAAKFLDEFLTEYAINNKSLYQSVQLARDSLEEFKTELPGAMFFPVICQNLYMAPPNWKDLTESYKKSRFILASVVTSIALILGIRQVGLLERFELKTYDLFLISRPVEKQDERILVVTINENDLEYFNQKGESVISDSNLMKILTQIKTYKPRVIGLDIIRDIPMKNQPEYQQLINYFKDQNNLFVICQDKRENGVGYPPPREVELNFVGLATLFKDNFDLIIRRQLLSQIQNIAQDSKCSVSESFSFKVAGEYLYQDNIEPDGNSKQLKIQDKIFSRLNNHSGGYHTLDDGGYQILINYRGKNEANSIKTISMIDFLKHPDNAEKYQNRIILIGYNFLNTTSKEDVFKTPYGEMSGVFIHAQMLSQILSTVLDNRPLIRVLPWWGDGIFIIIFGILGGGIIWIIKHTFKQGIIIIITISIISGSYYIVFWLQGIWLPLIPSILALLIPYLINLLRTKMLT